jgi:hypothetical protein
MVQLMSSSLSQWAARSGLSFWELLGVVAVDAVLVLTGGRGSGPFRSFARMAFRFVFGVAFLFGVVGPIVLLSKADTINWSEILLGELIFVPTGAVQLASLRAVPATA